MIEHLVLFKFKPEVGDDHITKVADALRALKTSVPGIIELTVGKNFSDRGQGHQLGLYVRFPDKGALSTYATHPKHVEVVTGLVRPYTENIIVSDYEI